MINCIARFVLFTAIGSLTMAQALRADEVAAPIKPLWIQSWALSEGQVSTTLTTKKGLDTVVCYGGFGGMKGADAATASAPQLLVSQHDDGSTHSVPISFGSCTLISELDGWSPPLFVARKDQASRTPANGFVSWVSNDSATSRGGK